MESESTAPTTVRIDFARALASLASILGTSLCSIPKHAARAYYPHFSASCARIVSNEKGSNLRPSPL